MKRLIPALTTLIACSFLSASEESHKEIKEETFQEVSARIDFQFENIKTPQLHHWQDFNTNNVYEYSSENIRIYPSRDSAYTIQVIEPIPAKGALSFVVPEHKYWNSKIEFSIKDASTFQKLYSANSPSLVSINETNSYKGKPYIGLTLFIDKFIERHFQKYGTLPTGKKKYILSNMREDGMFAQECFFTIDYGSPNTLPLSSVNK